MLQCIYSTSATSAAHLYDWQLISNPLCNVVVKPRIRSTKFNTSVSEADILIYHLLCHASNYIFSKIFINQLHTLMIVFKVQFKFYIRLILRFTVLFCITTNYNIKFQYHSNNWTLTLYYRFLHLELVGTFLEAILKTNNVDLIGLNSQWPDKAPCATFVFQTVLG